MKRTSPSCARWQRLLPFSEDEQALTPTEEEALESHLVECPECRNLYADTQRMYSALRARAHVAPLPSSIAQEIRLQATFRKDLPSRARAPLKRKAPTLLSGLHIKQPLREFLRFVILWLLLCISLLPILLILPLDLWGKAILQLGQTIYSELNIVTGISLGLAFLLGILVGKRMRFSLAKLWQVTSSFVEKLSKISNIFEQESRPSTLRSISKGRKNSPLRFQDKLLRCRECGDDFTFTAKEQEFYHEKGLLNLPSRCLHCRYMRSLEEGVKRQTWLGDEATYYCNFCKEEHDDNEQNRVTTIERKGSRNRSS